MSALTKVEQHRTALSTALTANIDYVQSVIPKNKEDEFRTNFMELAQNGYLMEKIPAKEILITALNATKMGLNVNPIYKELYVLPFNVKGKGMVASIVTTFNGNAQMAYNNGFFLKVDPVFMVQGTALKKSEIPIEHLVEIKSTDQAWVKENMLGWFIGLEDISNSEIKLPYQEVFVEFGYAMHVAKELQSPDHLMQTLLHKAVRRAITEMIIPRGRGFITPDEHEAVVVDATETTATDTAEETTVDLKSIGDTDAVEAVIEEVITYKTVMAYYVNSDVAKQGKITEIMAKSPDWKTWDSQKLSELLEELKGL